MKLGNAMAKGAWKIEIRDPHGALIREDHWENRVVDEGLDYLLKVGLAGGSQSSSWYIGLTDGSPTTSQSDSLGSASWSEVTAYDESKRQAWTAGSVSNQSVDNDGNEASFTIDTNSTTVGGAFLADADSGTSGILYAVGAFNEGDATLPKGSTITVKATFTQANDDS